MRLSCHLWAFLSAGCLLVLVGCGGQKFGDVSGKVSAKGTPITQGTISFYSETGTPKVVTGAITEGKYSAKVPVGPAKVAFTSIKPSTETTINPDGSKGAPPLKGPYVPLDTKMGSADTSGQTYTVTDGAQTKDFDLP